LLYLNVMLRVLRVRIWHDSCVSAGVQKRSFLLLLDASNMKEVARAWTKDPVALGFHGHFGKLDEFKQQQQQPKASVQ